MENNTENQISKRIVTLEERNANPHDQTIDHKAIKVLDKGFVRLVDCMGSDAAIVQMARVSYGAGTKSVSEDEGLIRYLLRNRHTSPFEGVQFKFHIKLPIFVSNQWVRHRMWSYNQMSGRYSEMPDEFYVPDENVITTQNPDNKQGGTSDLVQFERTPITLEICRDDKGELKVLGYNESWKDHFEKDQINDTASYQQYLQSGMRKELARINLPLSQYTEMYATVDLHNLFHFLKLRQDSHAQYEIRVYADALLELIRPIIPISVKAYEDYILNGVYFSKQEQEVLNDILDIFWHHCELSDEDWKEKLSELVSEKISNKRERAELMAKFTKIGKCE